MNLCPIYPLFPCSDILSQVWGGGGGIFFFHFMLFPTFLETNNSGNTKVFFLEKQFFSLNVFFVFCYARSISNIFRFFF